MFGRALPRLQRRRGPRTPSGREGKRPCGLWEEGAPHQAPECPWPPGQRLSLGPWMARETRRHGRGLPASCRPEQAREIVAFARGTRETSPGAGAGGHGLCTRPGPPRRDRHAAREKPRESSGVRWHPRGQGRSRLPSPRSPRTQRGPPGAAIRSQHAASSSLRCPSDKRAFPATMPPRFSPRLLASGFGPRLHSRHEPRLEMPRPPRP
mmetsp:Transcript_550/g.1760  ORF Transcript_550/g.1760 Transcript_550/m.1760 type:complete len:209 (-) Transcript_550:381-1007(-)